MPSLRTRLTVQYAGAMFATIVLVAGAVFVARRATTFSNAAELAASRAEIAVRVLRRDRLDVTVRAPQFPAPPGDSVVMRPEDRAALQPQTRELLSVVRGFLVVFGVDGSNVYQSLDQPIAGSPLLAADSASLNAAINRLRQNPGQSWTRATVGGRDLVMVVRRDSEPAYRGFWVFSAVEVSPSRTAFELLGSVLLVLPIIIGISIVSAYRIADRVVKPLGAITTEVTAITDGRSLHRRLPVVTEADELARLSTQLNSMIERLETSFAALRRFTADASHELKTPLSVLRTDVERAMRAPAGSTEQMVALEEALQETTRMANLVESLLTLARADEGRFDLHREPVDLEPLVRDVHETAVILGEDAGLEVRMPVLERAVVLGDRTRLRQLFLNLITNAIKYTPRGGEVELSLVRSDHEATFSVRDTGIGIAAADVPHIFERFYRADRARSRMDERGGFGLGLSISQWIAQAHGGVLAVQSRLHRGSTFTVTLPIAARDSQVQADAIDRSEPVEVA